MSALSHTVKWETDKNEVIREIIQFSNLPQCQHVNLSLKFFQHFIYTMLCTDYFQVKGNPLPLTHFSVQENSDLWFRVKELDKS